MNPSCYVVLLSVVFAVLGLANASAAVAFPTITLSYMPLYATLQPGQGVLSQISFRNTGSTSEYVNLSSGNSMNNTLLIYTNSTLLQPSQSFSTDIKLGSSPNAAPGVYYLPVYISVGSGSNMTRQTEYITLNIQNEIVNKPYVSSQVDLINNSNAATGIIQISSPKNISIDNLTLRTLVVLPLSTTLNASQITAYGLENNVSVQNSSYVINWRVQHIPANGSVYAYYTVTRSSSLGTLDQINELFSPPSYPVVKTGNLKVLNLSIPTIYLNATNKIGVEFLYTGSTAQHVNLSLTTLSGMTVYNGTQAVEAQPNTPINASFEVLTNNNIGTLIMNLSISTKGSNVSYTLTEPVVPKQAASGATSSIESNALVYAVLIIENIIVIMLIISYLLGRRSKHRDEKALAEVKEDKTQNGAAQVKHKRVRRRKSSKSKGRKKGKKAAKGKRRRGHNKLKRRKRKNAGRRGMRRAKGV